MNPHHIFYKNFGVAQLLSKNKICTIASITRTTLDKHLKKYNKYETSEILVIPNTKYCPFDEDHVPPPKPKGGRPPKKTPKYPKKKK